MLFACSLYFDPKDGDSIFLRNVGELIPDTRRYIPGDITLPSDRRENLKSRTGLVYVCTFL
jgi:hypothetical protein